MATRSSGSNSSSTPDDAAEGTTSTTNGSVPEQKQQQEQQQQHPAGVRRSIAVKMIRHAESENNQVYRDAHHIYRGGTPAFDVRGWQSYVDQHRQADPGLSTDAGIPQADLLARYLVPLLSQQAQPAPAVSIVVSPMRRTCETIRPTLQELVRKQQQQQQQGEVETEWEDRLLTAQNQPPPSSSSSLCQVLVHGFYFESEGCHLKDQPEEGMTFERAKQILYPDNESNSTASSSLFDIQAVGFPDPDRGWYCHGTGPETRHEAEVRAAKFYTWLCEHLDRQLSELDVADATALLAAGSRTSSRQRHVQLLVGHGDFMSLVLKRIVAGFGHSVETSGIPHRSAFVHHNTAITDLEYFGKGRFLIMCQNSTPHLHHHPELRTGGSLKDGWSYLMPSDRILLNAEVTVAFSDEELEDHVLEQKEALKALYLSSSSSSQQSEIPLATWTNGNVVQIEEDGNDRDRVQHFIAKRGLQVIGVATYAENTRRLTDVAVRPSAGKEGAALLFSAVKEHTKKLGRSGSLLVLPRNPESKQLFESFGFLEVEDAESEHLELIH
jgi:phosphohistidine phosphatase SixA